MHILFEDNHCLVVSKTAPLLTQAPAGVPSLEADVKNYLKEKYHKAGNVYLGVPHRLDRPVSGVIVFARNSKAAQRLADQFQKRQVAKTYWGLVNGVMKPAAGTWEDWLLKIQAEARSVPVAPQTPGAKSSLLTYRVLAQHDAHALIEFTPLTGRMHQIRLQASLHGHPILGDILYGSTEAFGPAAELPRERVIALHARNLSFLHPLSYQPMTFTAPLPEYWPTDSPGAAIPGLS